ncbi:hypothetical protein pb186bvf_004823 [Paramecium bursaria]
MIRIIYVNLIFAVFMSSISSGLNIITQTYEQNNYGSLGYVSVFIIFTFGLVGNIVCVTYVEQLKFSYSFFIHSLGYLLFLTCGIYICGFDGNAILVWIMTIIASAVSGFCSSGLFITQNSYISHESKNPELAFGIGWAILQLSVVIGSIYSAFLVEQLGQYNFFICIVVISAVSSMGFLFVKQKTNQVSELEVIINSTSQHQNQQNLIATLQVIKEPDVKYMIFPMMITGVLLSFQWSVMHKLIEISIDQDLENETINKLTFLVFFTQGIAEVMGGLFLGLFNKKSNMIDNQQILFGILELALLIIIINIEIKSYTLCFVVAYLWGIIDCGTTSTLLAIISTRFQKDIRMFALFNFCQCFGGMLATSATIFLVNENITLNIGIILIFQILSKFSMNGLSIKS